MNYDEWEATVQGLVDQYKQDVKGAIDGGLDPNTVGVPVLPPPPPPQPHN